MQEPYLPSIDARRVCLHDLISLDNYFAEMTYIDTVWNIVDCHHTLSRFRKSDTLQERNNDEEWYALSDVLYFSS